MKNTLTLLAVALTAVSFSAFAATQQLSKKYKGPNYSFGNQLKKAVTLSTTTPNIVSFTQTRVGSMDTIQIGFKKHAKQLLTVGNLTVTAANGDVCTYTLKVSKKGNIISDGTTAGVKKTIICGDGGPDGAGTPNQLHVGIYDI